jgi:hypothetical protein
MFKGKNLQTSWFSEENLPDSHITITSKGWISNDIALRWLKEVYVPETAHTLNNSQTALWILILDEHGSHVSIEL